MTSLKKLTITIVARDECSDVLQHYIDDLKETGTLFFMDKDEIDFEVPFESVEGTIEDVG
jgi:hypothetical protein